MNYQTLSKKSLDKLPPFALEAEQQILSALFIDPHRFHEVRAIMEASDFYRPSHTTIYTAMSDLFDEYGGVDLLLLRDRLHQQGVLDQVGGPAYLVGLVDAAVTATNVAYHAALVREKALKRQLLCTCIEAATKLYDDRQPVQELLRAVQEDLANVAAGMTQHLPWVRFQNGDPVDIVDSEYLGCLDAAGFKMMELSQDALFVRVQHQIVQETRWYKSINISVKQYIKALTDQTTDLWNMVLSKGGRAFGHTMLTGMNTIQDTQFLHDTKACCHLFFQNGCLRVGAARVDFLSYQQLDGLVWQDSIIPYAYHGRYHLELSGQIRRDLYAAMKAKQQHRVNVLRRTLNQIHYFEIEHQHPASDDDIFHLLDQMMSACMEAKAFFTSRPDLEVRENKEIAILDAYRRLQEGDGQTCDYERFLEKVANESFTDEEGVTHHINNKPVFEYGLYYLIHHYNDPVNRRAVVIVDNDPSFFADGRRGKRILLDGLRFSRSNGTPDGCVITEDGKNFEGTFKFQRIKPNTKTLIIDDVDETKVSFKDFYSSITDGMVIEGKGRIRFAFTLGTSPKLAFTTNRPFFSVDRSSTERLLVLPMTDYFTKEGCRPLQVFNHSLFYEWDQTEWNRFFDYIVRIIQENIGKTALEVPNADLTVFNANRLMLEMHETLVNYLDELPRDTDHERSVIESKLQECGVTFKRGDFRLHLEKYCRLRDLKLFKNTKDGRYKRNGIEYIRFDQTGDLFGRE